MFSPVAMLSYPLSKSGTSHHLRAETFRLFHSSCPLSLVLRLYGLMLSQDTRALPYLKKKKKNRTLQFSLKSQWHPDILFLKHASSIFRRSPNRACGFSMMEQVRLCAVKPTENRLGSSMNHFQGWKTVWICHCHALEKGCQVQTLSRKEGGPEAPRLSYT